MTIKMKFLRGVAACALATAPLFAHSQTVSIAGPEALAEILIPATLEAFARDSGLTVRREILGAGTYAMVLVEPSSQSTEARFEVRVANSTAAIAELALRSIDVAVTSRTANEDEAAALVGVTPFVLGRDALVPVVARNNPVGQITPELLADVLAGDIKSWSDLGGPVAPIRIHLLEPGTDQDAFLRARLLGDRGRARGIKLHLSNSGISDAVAADPLSIGVTSFSEIGNARKLAIGGDCGLAVQAGRLAIKNEDYPLAKPVMVYARNETLPPAALEFLDYLSSDAAQGPIRQAGFVDSLPEEIGLPEQGERLISAIRIVGRQSPPSELRRLVDTLEGAKRLSLTLRFQPKSSELDEASQASVAQLGMAIRTGEYDGRRVIFVGFSDGVGTSEQNLRVGRSRARAVEEAVREATGELAKAQQVEIVSDAFGEAMPLACDETDWGRHANRRVEVWVE